MDAGRGAILLFGSVRQRPPNKESEPFLPEMPLNAVRNTSLTSGVFLGYKSGHVPQIAVSL